MLPSTSANDKQMIVAREDFEISFRSGLKKIISRKYLQQIDEMYKIYRKTKDNQPIFFPDGSMAMISDFEMAVPLEKEEVKVFEKQAQENNARIIAAMEASKLVNPSVRERWINHIKLNTQRLRDGLPWQYADKDCNPCTKEEARLSVFGGEWKPAVKQEPSELEWAAKDVGLI